MVRKVAAPDLFIKVTQTPSEPPRDANGRVLPVRTHGETEGRIFANFSSFYEQVIASVRGGYLKLVDGATGQTVQDFAIAEFGEGLVVVIRSDKPTSYLHPVERDEENYLVSDQAVGALVDIEGNGNLHSAINSYNALEASIMLTDYEHRYIGACERFVAEDDQNGYINHTVVDKGPSVREQILHRP